MHQLINWIKKERVPVGEIPVDNLFRELTFFISYALLYLVVVWVFSHLIKAFPVPIMGAVSFTMDFWYVVVVKIGFLLVVPIWAYIQFGYSADSLFIYRYERIGRNIRASVLAFVIGMSLNISHIPAILEQLSQPHMEYFVEVTMALTIPFFAAALPEELFYRVMLQTRLEKEYGWLASILISAVLFSLFHLPSRFVLASGVEGTAGDFASIATGTLLPTFIIGVVLGFLWNRYRNLLLLLALHYGIDLLPALSSMLGISK